MGSYIYIVLIVGYYLYKAYAANKKKQMENAEPFPKQSTTQHPSKKGFFDTILEEIEKAQEAQQQTPKPNPAPVVTAPKSKPIKTKKALAEPMIFEQTSFLIEEEGQRVTADSPIFSEEKKVKKSKGFGGMNMSPKEALKAQIILERKF